MKTLQTSIPPDVSELFELPVPILSVYLGGVPPTHEYSTADLHGAVLRAVAQGSPPKAVEALRKVIEEIPAGTEAKAVFIGADGSSRLFPIPGAPGEDRVIASAVPHLTPLLAWWQTHPAHVVAVVDRAGADITVFPAGDHSPTSTTVTGPDDEIVRTAPGGPAQPRYQRRAEDSWKHNAGHDVEAIAAALERSDARLLLVAGDIRTIQLLTDQLPAWIQNEVEVRMVSGGRSEDGSTDLRAQQVEAEMTEAAHRHGRRLLEEFADRSGQNGRSVEGVAATLRALARGQVRTLLVTDQAADGGVAWFGPAATDIGLHVTGLTRNGVEPERGPVTDVAVRAALLGGADVWVLDPRTPGAPYHGVGALCRFP
ncbi:Vms1/Ankzf1 family peptidyl-tRNA hydrolase [Catenulispora subtropica]|uniref:Vms1/Ankzf1 family peptidyl-tRNA hydrolase n=1 Tax=Catenulispora subtropica TaxID=450798 RepID=A0ABP5D382_9ACTN